MKKQKGIMIKDSVKAGLITKNSYNSNKNSFFVFFTVFLLFLRTLRRFF